MDKKTFKKLTLELIQDRYQYSMELAEKVIDNMDENLLAEYDLNYFAPKAFYEALCNFNRDIVNSRHGYTMGFVRKHNNAVRTFSHEITYKRF